jgi:hypothetical protein
MTLKSRLNRTAAAVAAAACLTLAQVAPLRAHEPVGGSTKAVEAHRKTDFGFKGFDKVNRRLQKDFENFDYAASASAYRRAMSLAFGNPNAHLEGEWSPVISMPVVAIHTSVLPNGKVLMWDSISDLPAESVDGHNFTRAVVWDPVTGAVTPNNANTGYNLFCAGHASMPDGKLFIAGGNRSRALDGLDTMHTFNWANNSWALLGFMNQGSRWYPSVTALARAEMLISSGVGVNTPEVRTASGTMRSLTNAVLSMPLYPWMQPALNGRTLYFGPDNTLSYLNTSGTGAWQHFGGRDGINRDYGAYAMYDAGKILVAGGSNSSQSSYVVDINGATPAAAPTGNLNTGRRQHNLTVLPDGSVLATGGNFNGAALVNVGAGVYTAELWNPATGLWQTLASMQRTRQYHSTAVLLPDARVMVGGGGICGDCFNQGYLEKNIEIFSPPYLFKQDGSGDLAPRPVINNAIVSVPSRVITIGADATTTPVSTISKVVMIRDSSVTHSVNFEQRRVPLSFSVNTSNNTITATAPTDPNVAPPGYYMVFIINSSGVPSVAKMVQLPTFSNIANSSWVGGRYNFFASHSDKIMEVAGGSTADGTPLVQGDINDVNGISPQNFILALTGYPINQQYQFMASHSNKCLEPSGGSTADLVPIVGNTCTAMASQLWTFQSVAGVPGGYKIINAQSNKCVDVSGASQNNGAQLIQNTCNGAASQTWKARRR